jgi:hypothetical protein
MFATYNFLDKDVSSFLNGSDFISFICTNKSIYNSLIKEISNKKAETLKQVINSYYVPRFPGFSFINVSEKKLPLLLDNLPILFSFITEKNIKSLELTFNSKFGFYPKYLEEYYNGNYENIVSKLIEQINNNKTLETIYFGVLGESIYHQKLKQILVTSSNINNVSTISTGFYKKNSGDINIIEYSNY